MNYLIFSPYSTDCTNAATLLDYALRKIDEDIDTYVYFVYLDSFLTKMNDVNIHNSNIRGLEIKFDNWLLRHAVHHERIIYVPLSNFIKKEINLLFEFFDLNKMKSISYKDINIGYGVVSSFVSFFRNINPVFSDDVHFFFNNYLNATANVVEGLLNLCQVIAFDAIVTFNGRFATQRAAIEVARFKGINFITIEHTSLNKYKTIKSVTFDNCMPHSIINATKECNNIWKKITPDEIKLARSFFEKRAKGIVAGDRVYIDKQIDGTLPDDWDENKINLVFFSSSEDEFFSIDSDWENLRLFKNQEEAICEISRMCMDNPRIHIYLRIHPHLIGLPFSYAKYTSAYNLNNVTVIPAESPISTYELIRKCNACLTMGSTTGIEAAYWGRPSILLGGSLYYGLDAVYCPKDKEELKIMLHSDLKAKPQENALKMAAFVCGINRGFPPYAIDYKPFLIKFLGKEMDIASNMKIFGSRYIYIVSKIIFRLLDLVKKNNFNNKIKPQLIIEKK